MAEPPKRTHWKRQRATKPFELTAEEAECCKVALRVLRVRHGTWGAVAKRLGLRPKTLVHNVADNGRPTAATALAVARLAGVPIDDVLAGRWPPAGCCPMCGRAE